MLRTPGPERANTRRRRHLEDATLFRLLVDRVLDYAIFLLTPDGHIASWNAGAARLKGYTADEIIGESFERFYPDEARRAGLPQRLLSIARTEGRVENEGWRVRKDGTRFWADVVITALYDDAGELRGFAKVTRDLTERRAGEEELRRSEERFRTLIDSVKDYAIFLLSPEGTVLSWNQGAQQLKGYAPAEIIGQSFERFYPPEGREAGMPQRLLAIARAEGRVEDEGWRVRKDGSRFWADVVITALRDERGELIGYAKVTRDLTERRQAENDRAARLAAERAAERMERLQVATAALAAAIRPEQAAEVLTDVAARAVEAAVAAVGVPIEDGARLEVLDVRAAHPSILHAHQQLGPDDPYPLAQAWRTNHALFLESREHIASQWPDLAPLLSSSALEAWAAFPLAVEGRSLGVLGLAFDTARVLDTDERGFLLALAEVGAQAMDRARLYASELAARTEAEAAVRAQDEFLSVAAHELRTPVAAVKATAQLAERTMERGRLEPERMAAHLQRIGNAADRLGALIEDLLDVSRLRTGRVRLRCRQLDFRGLLEEVVGRYEATERRHQFSLSSPDGPLIIEADPLRIEQVVENLLSNAVKYSPNGGTIQLRLAQAGDGVSLTVTDQGIGLPPGQEDRIFEAFGRGSNATDQQIQGLGLGLAICRQLIDFHGGRIWASSPGVGLGTTLSIWLPSVAVVADEASATGQGGSQGARG
jgi:PAS domain S-box-containing protein